MVFMYIGKKTIEDRTIKIYAKMLFLDILVFYYFITNCYINFVP